MVEQGRGYKLQIRAVSTRVWVEEDGEKSITQSHSHELHVSHQGINTVRMFRRQRLGLGRGGKTILLRAQTRWAETSTEAVPKSTGNYGVPPEEERQNRGDKKAGSCASGWELQTPGPRIHSSQPVINVNAHWVTLDLFNAFNHIHKSHKHVYRSEFLPLRAWLRPLIFGSQYSFW